MRVFINFWKLETENSPLQIEFWEQFLFSVHFELPNKFFSLKNRKLFLKIENKGKKQLPNIPLISFKHHVEKEMLLFAGKPVVIGYCWYISQWSLSGWSSLDGEFESHDSCIVDS